MKKNISTLLTLLLCSVATGSDTNLPNISQESSAGRLQVFPTVKPVLWFLPIAFTVDLDCSPTSPNTSCILRIKNMPSADELSTLRMMVTPGQQIAAVSDLGGVLIHEIREQFRDLDPELNTAVPLLLKTLSFTGNEAYASIGFRVPSTTGEKLKERFHENGIGSFESEVRFSAERSEDYLAIKDSDAIRKVMEDSLLQPLVSSSLKSRIRSALENSQLVTHNLERSEALTAAYPMILVNFFEVNPNGFYQAKREKLDSLPKTLVLVDETYAPLTIKCRASIILKQAATQTIQCAQEEK